MVRCRTGKELCLKDGFSLLTRGGNSTLCIFQRETNEFAARLQCEVEGSEMHGSEFFKKGLMVHGE